MYIAVCVHICLAISLWYEGTILERTSYTPQKKMIARSQGITWYLCTFWSFASQAINNSPPQIQRFFLVGGCLQSYHSFKQFTGLSRRRVISRFTSSKFVPDWTSWSVMIMRSKGLPSIPCSTPVNDAWKTTFFGAGMVIYQGQTWCSTLGSSTVHACKAGTNAVGGSPTMYGYLRGASCLGEVFFAMRPHWFAVYINSHLKFGGLVIDHWKCYPVLEGHSWLSCKPGSKAITEHTWWI